MRNAHAPPALLSPPRAAKPDVNGFYIPDALLNLDCEWVSLARIKQYVYYCCFIANPPVMVAGAQASVCWRNIAERYHLMTKQPFNHVNVMRAIIRKIKAVVYPPNVEASVPSKTQKTENISQNH